MFKVTPSKWGDLEQREILWLEKFIQISLARTVTCDICTNQTVVSAHPWTHWEKLTFDQSFVSKQHQLIKFFHLRIVNKAKKEGQRSWGTFRKFLEWRAETFCGRSKTQTTCNMAVIDTDQWVSMEKVWLFNVTPLFNVAPLDGNC